MIVQKFKQGTHEIKIEIAENLEDMKKNGFKDGQFNKYYVDGKYVDTYGEMIGYIIEENRKNRESIIPNREKTEELRKKMIQNTNNDIIKSLDILKEQYRVMGVPYEMLQKIEDISLKINGAGVRTEK